MDEQEKLLAHVGLQMLVNEFFNALDSHRTDDLIALFMVEGVWARGNDLLKAPDNIRAALDARSATRRSRHLTSNLRILDFDGRRARISYSLTTYAANEDGESPPSVTGPVAVLDCEDIAVKTAGGWRFERRSSRQQFRGKG